MKEFFMRVFDFSRLVQSRINDENHLICPYAAVSVPMRQTVMICNRILQGGGGYGFHIIGTLYPPCALPRFAQGRQKHPCKNRDDRNHDEELYKGENVCFHPRSKKIRTRNSERRNRKTFEQLNEERRSKVAQGLTASSL